MASSAGHPLLINTDRLDHICSDPHEREVRLLAPELARKEISINAVCPTFVAAGVNAQADDLQIKRERALIPMGRLCETQDIVGAVRYLLSPASSFISGQSIVLSGAQL